MSRQCLLETANTCERHHHHLHNHQHHHYNEVDGSGFILSGYHKKLKTMKKKYFVLYRDSMNNVARLEYYDNDKKFKSGFNAKRIIKLRNCFNISRRMDTKYEFVIALATKEGGFGIVIDSEVEMNKWLNNLLSLQQKYSGECDLPLFDHVWQVVIQRKGLAEQKGLIGNYHVCLTGKSITFLKISSARSTLGNGNNQRLQRVDVLLTTVRRCGDSQCYFYMEIGRQSTIGPGELWMETEDSLIAKNMHGMILNKMTSINETQVEPMRKRSSSATETTKPINDMQRKIVQTLSTNLIRKRCDSLPSRNCVTNNDIVSTIVSTSVKSSTTASVISCQHQQLRSNALNQSHNSSGTIINSESEESSASFEESDDAVLYSLYRLSTQNVADGIIPEEGPDESCIVAKTIKDSNDITNADNFKYCLPGVQTTSNLKSANIAGKYLHINNNKYVTEKHSKEFALEHNIDAITNVNEADLSSLRPVRAYSVGNRIQHNLQVIKEKCDENSDNFVGRARAFSVGSKTKAAKFETCSRSSPRAMMHICSSMNSNNNYCNNNVNDFYCIMDGSAKKSTSVPLLSSKRYHASSEEMSDLMEIDFSKSSKKYTNSNIIINKRNDTPIMMTMASTEKTSRFCEQNKSFESLDIVDCAISSWTPKVTAISDVDNVYLEMRPISTSTNLTTEMQQKTDKHDFMNFSIISHTINKNNATLNSSDLTLSANDKLKEDLSLNYTNYSNNDKGSLVIPREENCCGEIDTISNKDDENDNVNSNRAVPINTTAATYVSNRVPSKTINSETRNAINNRDIFSAPEELSSRENLNNNGCLNSNEIEELVNVKQQQSLKFLKLQYKKSCSNEHLLSQNNASPTRNLSVAMINRKMESSSPIIEKVSLNTVNNLNNTLYYASLDLPVCNNEYSTKSIHPNSLSSENFYDKTLVNNIKNVYAKIDFDHPEALSFTRQNS